jgi:hypothetical protein
LRDLGGRVAHAKPIGPQATADLVEANAHPGRRLFSIRLNSNTFSRCVDLFSHG